MKKRINLVLCIFYCILISGCQNQSNTSQEEPQITNSEYVCDLPAIDNDEVDKLSLEHELGRSIYHSNRIKNAVQGYYSDYNRSSFIVKNSTMQMSHKLLSVDGDVSKSKVVSSFKNSKGQDYFNNSMDVFIRNKNDYVYGKDFEGYTRVNTNKLGYYYYEVNVRGYDFSSFGYDVNVEKTFNTYSDQLRTNFRAISQGTTSIDSIGFELKILNENIEKIECYDGKEYFSLNDKELINESNIQYVAFNIKNVGVIGAIFPQSDNCKVSLFKNDYVTILRQEQLVFDSKLTANQEAEVNNRIYNDETSSFDGIRKANQIEKNPYDEKQVIVDETKDNAKFLGYDFKRGAYTFNLDSMSFYDSYYVTPNKKFFESIKINPTDDREIYIYIKCDRPVEGATIIDKNNIQIPIPVEICKNFGHENEEPIYETGDPFYGIFIFPIATQANKELSFTLISVMQNWGNYKIKQLSSISYSIGYYHMSTGVTETNCIAPYFCNNLATYEDYGWGWFIPDFRGPSGKMWDYGDPQFNSVGIVCIPSNNKTRTKANYVNSNIVSSGLIYNDLRYSYISDDNNYKFDMRHVEMAQDDESRTYYEIDFEILNDTTLKAKDFSIIGFDGKNTDYKKYSYLDENNNHVVIDAKRNKGEETFNILNSKSSYFTVYDRTNTAVENNNFGLIVKNATLNSTNNLKLAMYTNFGKIHTKSNYVSLTLGENMKLKKGDKLHLEIILLPFGDEGKMVENGDNIIKVYNDSVVDPLTCVSSIGTSVNDSYVNTIKAANNEAKAIYVGGSYKDNSVTYALKFTNFTKLGKPQIKKDDKDYLYSKESEGYDGYQVSYENKTFTYSFNITKAKANETYSISL